MVILQYYLRALGHEKTPKTPTNAPLILGKYTQLELFSRVDLIFLT